MRLHVLSRFLGLFGLALLLALTAQPAAAADFYAGKTITIFVGSAPGGSYDGYARLVARHIGGFIPGHPAIVVKNMPGAGSRTMTNYVDKIAPKDGTAIAAPLNTIPLDQIMEPQKTKYDAAKFNWLGAVSSPANVLVTWHTSGVKTLDDARKKEVTIGATTPGTTQEMYPLMANNLFGTKFKVITGYKASTEVNVAMERGEVQGRGANTYISYRIQDPEWLRDKKLNFIFQMTAERDPELKDVPTLLEYAKTDEQRKIITLLVTTEATGRSYFAPPGVPADRVAVLRKALSEVVKNPAFLADAKKVKLDVTPVSGEKLQKMVADLIATPPDIVAKYKAAVTHKN
jgi:tripartite-type tricarboxylate transporter receptor subunit TctC